MKKVGLIGYPLGHSFSKKYFDQKFQTENISNWQYELFPLPDIEQFPVVLAQNPEVVGLNVTIPHKQAVMAYLDDLSEEAKTIGAVNTIVVKSGKTIGYNTDWIGFKNSLISQVSERLTGALVLGSGGSSKAVCFALSELNVPFKIVSRYPQNAEIGYDEITAEMVKSYPLVVNCTPLGTYPQVSESPPIPYQWLSPKNLLFDLVYNPPATTFLKNGKKYGANGMNGYDMLVLQAEASWSIWNIQLDE